MKKSELSPFEKLKEISKRNGNQGWNWKYMAFALEKGYKDPDEALKAIGNNSEYMAWVGMVSLEFRNMYGISMDFNYPLSGAEIELYNNFIGKRASKFIK